MILKLTEFPDFETIRLGLAFIALLLDRVAQNCLLIDFMVHLRPQRVNTQVYTARRVHQSVAN